VCAYGSPTFLLILNESHSFEKLVCKHPLQNFILGIPLAFSLLRRPLLVTAATFTCALSSLRLAFPFLWHHLCEEKKKTSNLCPILFPIFFPNLDQSFAVSPPHFFTNLF